MAIRQDDGQFALDIYLNEDDDEENRTEYSDTYPELEVYADALIKGGRYRYCELYRWNAGKDDWDFIRSIEPE